MTLTPEVISIHSPIKLAASTYLNSAPLVWSFLHGPRRNAVEFIDAVPAKCAHLLFQGKVDVALVPVIEYQRTADVSLVRDVCVGSKDEVRSVLLVSRKPELEAIRAVALDESSRTSATLLKIIFREFLHRDAKWTTQSPNLNEMLEKNDAALIIGDPAMGFPRSDLKIWDMASLWRNYTGLGFVFAMWMVRNERATEAAKIDFATVRDEGVSQIEDIVSAYREKIPMSVQELRRYLTENIVYRIDKEMASGLHLYFDLAFKHGLIDELRVPDFS